MNSYDNKLDWRVKFLDATSITAPVIAMVMLLAFKSTLSQIMFYLATLFLVLLFIDGWLRFVNQAKLKRVLQSAYIGLSVILYGAVIYLALRHYLVLFK